MVGFSSRRIESWSSGAAGVAAVSISLVATEAMAVLVPGTPRLVLVVAARVVDSTPGWFASSMVQVLGAGAKPVLVAAIVVTIVAVGFVVGIIATRMFVAAAAILVAGGVLAGIATVADPSPSRLLGIPSSAISVIAGALVLRALLGMGRPVPVVNPGVRPSTDIDSRTWTRRRFLAASVIGTVAGVVGLSIAFLYRSIRGFSDRASVVLPALRESLPSLAPTITVPGISPQITPTTGFYRVDTAIVVPEVALSAWRLRVTGLVEHSLELTYEDLVSWPQREEYVTISCVSNLIGGSLVGNASWRGIALHELLDAAGVENGATQVVGRSVDGFTTGIPIDVAYDGRPAMVAIGMNGEPLPYQHGFPARLIVSGLYGYVSATKWLTELEVTRWEDFDAYWVRRGWNKEGAVGTQSRIDVPTFGKQLAAGRTMLAGVAWAPNRGISAVEVMIDETGWRPATLSGGTRDTWRQWEYLWHARPGDHEITVRGVDGAGLLQTSDRVPIFPGGATGYHSIRVVVGQG